MVAEWPMFTYLHFTSSSSCVRHTSSHATTTTTTNTLDVTPDLSKPFEIFCSIIVNILVHNICLSLAICSKDQNALKDCI